MKVKNLFIIKRLQQWQKIFLALVLGTLLGLFVGPPITIIKPIGILFIHAINMMIVPVVFTAIINAVLSMDDLKIMRRISIKAFTFYMFSMAIAASIGLWIGNLFTPGAGLKLNLQAAETTTTLAPSLSEIIVNIIPTNPVAALASGNILQILVFALILGLSIQLAGDKGKPVADFFKSFGSVAIKLSQLVMSFAPIGIFALMAWIAGEYGLSALIPLMKLVLTVYFACFLMIIFYYSGTLFAYTRCSPKFFFRSISDAMLFAFSTSSSTATLPVTMRCAEENLKISKKLSGFLLPLGTTLNLNGLSIYLGVATVFAANISGIQLDWTQYVTVIFTIILTAMGAGGVPGSAIIVMSAVFNSVGLPLGTVALISGVDRLIDMAQTTTSVVGDLHAAYMVAHSENELNLPDFSIQKSSTTNIIDLPNSAIE
ncbi:MAG: dicarboxylate/amino acid:cation symporter [Gammaproteobacteria bacterium]|nr:dicarboxylate/amino acid:cation symporter [Gammaproteobacteria bacterium]